MVNWASRKKRRLDARPYLGALFGDHGKADGVVVKADPGFFAERGEGRGQLWRCRSLRAQLGSGKEASYW